MGKVEGAAAGVPPPGPGDMYNGDDGAAGLGTGPGTGPGTKRVLIFGSGWGSSGTTSLNEALGLLGINSLHYAGYLNASSRTRCPAAWWDTGLPAYEFLDSELQDRLCRYRAGGAVDISLFRGVLEQLPAELQAFLDTPIPYYFRYLFKAYPDALVIHQHRANVSAWYRSRQPHVRRHGFANQLREGWDVPLLNIIDPPCRRAKQGRRQRPVSLVRKTDRFGGP